MLNERKHIVDPARTARKTTSKIIICSKDSGFCVGYGHQKDRSKTTKSYVNAARPGREIRRHCDGSGEYGRVRSVRER